MVIKICLIVLSVLLQASVLPAAEYYVSPDGADGDGTKGTPWGPSEVVWTTVDDENSTLYLMDGNYTSRLTVTHNTESNRLYIRPCSYAPDPSGCDGLVLFKFTEEVGNILIYLNSAHNVTLDGRKSSSDTTRNIKIIPFNNSAITIAASKKGNKIHYIEITGLLDDKDPAGCDANEYAISAGLVGTGTEISHCYFHENWGNCEIFVSSDTVSYGNVSVHDNVISSGTINYICGTGTGVDIYNNSFDTTLAYCPYDTIHFYRDGLHYIRIWNNTLVSDRTHAIFLENPATESAATEHIRIFNNTISCAGESCYISLAVHQTADNPIANGVLDDVAIVNNSFYVSDAETYIRMLTGVGSAAIYTNFIVKNNIFYNIDHLTTITNNNVTWDGDSNATFDHNLAFHSSAFNFQWMDDDFSEIKTYTSTTTFNSDHSASNATGDPLFVSSIDYTLQSGSPAIGAGEDLSALSDMPAGWPFDKNNVTRSGTWDIGAYEYSGSTPTIGSQSLSGGSLCGGAMR